MLTGEPSSDSGEEWQLLPEGLDVSLLRVGWEARWAQRQVLEADFHRLLELLDVRSAVRVPKHWGEMLDGIEVMVCSVV